jgi:hypothetical protein
MIPGFLAIRQRGIEPAAFRQGKAPAADWLWPMLRFPRESLGAAGVPTQHPLAKHGVLRQ